MDQKQEARDAFRALFEQLLQEELYTAIVKAQADAAAKVVANELWPTFAADKLRRLVELDRNFLSRATGLPSGFNEILIDALHENAEDRLKTTLPTNSYAKGAKLRAIIKNTVLFGDNQDRIHRLTDRIFAKEETDRLADPGRVQERVLVRLNNLCVAECQQFASGASPQAEDDGKRHLKVLSVLTNEQLDADDKNHLLAELTDGKTKSLPYLVRYLRYGTAPLHHASLDAAEPSTNVFSTELLSACSEANYIRDALARFLGHQGLVSEYLKVEAPVNALLDEHFARLPDMVPLGETGIFLPKGEALRAARRGEYSVPDGVTCAVSMGALLEWTIRQAIYVLKVSAHEKPRAVELYPRLATAGFIQGSTRDRLDTIFGEGTFALRDGLSHGAFFSNNRAGISTALGALCDALRLLTSDLQAHAPQVFTSPRWDGAYALSTKEQNAVQAQFRPGNNLIDQIQGDRGREHISKVLRALAPDKWFIGKASLLFWVSTQGKAHDPAVAAKQFAAIVNGLVTFEELFRAVQEYHGLPILRVTPSGNDVVKCELAMLDPGTGNLLQPASLTTLFGTTASEAEFGDSLLAVVNRRNALYHGKLAALGCQMAEYMHLVMKFIFALCTTVTV